MRYTAPMSPEDIQKLMIAFVERHPLGAVATVSAAGEPSLANVYVLAKSGFAFHFGTRTSTRKFEDLQQNPRVALTISDSDTLETLQLRGTASLITDTAKVIGELAELRSAFAKERTHWRSVADKATHDLYHVNVSHWIPPIGQMEGNYAFFEVKPSWARFRKYDADKDERGFSEYEWRE